MPPRSRAWRRAAVLVLTAPAVAWALAGPATAAATASTTIDGARLVQGHAEVDVTYTCDLGGESSFGTVDVQIREPGIVTGSGGLGSDGARCDGTTRTLTVEVHSGDTPTFRKNKTYTVVAMVTTHGSWEGETTMGESDRDMTLS